MNNLMPAMQLEATKAAQAAVQYNIGYLCFIKTLIAIAAQKTRAAARL
jgi:hypothetical protein